MVAGLGGRRCALKGGGLHARCAMKVCASPGPSTPASRLPAKRSDARYRRAAQPLDDVLTLDLDRRVPPLAFRDACLVRAECGLVDEVLVNLPDQWICRLHDVEGEASTLGAGQRHMQWQVRVHKGDLRCVRADELAGEVHVSAIAVHVLPHAKCRHAPKSGWLLREFG